MKTASEDALEQAQTFQVYLRTVSLQEEMTSDFRACLLACLGTYGYTGRLIEATSFHSQLVLFQFVHVT